MNRLIRYIAAGLARFPKPPLLTRQEGFHTSTSNIGAVEYSVGVSNTATLTTLAVTANIQYWWFFIAPDERSTCTEISCEITAASAGGTTLRLYLAENSNEGAELSYGDSCHPALILADSGDIAADSTGLKTHSTSVVLTPGRMYWIGIVATSTPTLRARSNSSTYGGIAALTNANASTAMTISLAAATFEYAPALTATSSSTIPLARYKLA